MLGTNHVLENSQKLPQRAVRPLGASMLRLTHGWVRTVRTAQNLHNADIHWAERAVEVDFVEPKLCIAGRLNQNCGHRASIMIVCDGLRTSVGYGDSTTSRRRIDTPRNAPSGAAAERALLFAPAVRRRSVGPHAWSRARVDRLAPLKEPKLSGEGSPFTLHRVHISGWGPYLGSIDASNLSLRVPRIIGYVSMRCGSSTVAFLPHFPVYKKAPCRP